MFLNCLLCLYAIIVCAYTQTQHADSEGFYWRDYGGYVPQDALPGGVENHTTTYLGQTLFKKLYIPATIVIPEGKAYFEWGGNSYSNSENIKILCTNYPERFDWVKTKHAEFRNIKDKQFVVAALEPVNQILYFGRIHHEGHLLAGKLLVNDKLVLLHTIYKGAILRKWEYEVLYYKPSAEEEEVPKKTHFSTLTSICSCNKRPVSMNFFTSTC